MGHCYKLNLEFYKVVCKLTTSLPDVRKIEVADVDF